MNRWAQALVVFVLMMPVLWLINRDKTRSFGEEVREFAWDIWDILIGLPFLLLPVLAVVLAVVWFVSFFGDLLLY